MQVRIEEDLDRAGDAFAIEIIRALQFWSNEEQIGIHLCTGESPFIGYRKIGGDSILEKKGLYNPKEYAHLLKRYARAGAILDTWEKPNTQRFLKENGLNPKLKPDMSKVIVFAIDALFPQRSTDYFAFSNLLNNICDLWAIPNHNRNLFYGDIYVTGDGSQWSSTRIPDAVYRKILESTNYEGLKLQEFQAACLVKNDTRAFSLNTLLQLKNGRVMGTRLLRVDDGDFEVRDLEITPLQEDHIQYRFLESMRNQALMMHQKLIEFGGAHITLLGVGPSYEGKGHIGFCESNTPFNQSCFIGAINDFDATFHIAAGHAKEFSGFKNMFTIAKGVRMPKFGFITFGPQDLFYRRYQDALQKRDTSQEVTVIVIATGNLKSKSIAKAIEADKDKRYPLSLTQDCRGVYVLDTACARDLRVEKCPWEFEVFPKGYWTKENILTNIVNMAESSNCKISSIDLDSLIHNSLRLYSLAQTKPFKQLQGNCKINFLHLRKSLKRQRTDFSHLRQELVRKILSNLIVPDQVTEKLNEWGVFKGDTVLFISPHMDDEFLAMMHLLKKMASHYDIYACYTSLGYNAVYSDYIFGLLKEAKSLPETELTSLTYEDKEALLKNLIEESVLRGRIFNLDYEVLALMSPNEKKLRAKLLLIDLNHYYGLITNSKKPPQYKFRSSKDIEDLLEFLDKVEEKRDEASQDLSIMRFLKTSCRFTEVATSLMYCGIAYKNIYWPLNLSFYGSRGRPLSIKDLDINKIKDIVARLKPKMIVFNGERFPDFGTHSNTEMGTYIALFELLKKRALKGKVVLFQWAGVWDRITLADAQLSVVLTHKLLQEFYNAFNYFYPTQAPYAPIPNASSDRPQSFALNVIENAIKGAQELTALLDVPKDLEDILNQKAGILHYRITRLKDQKSSFEFLSKKKKLKHAQTSIDISSNTALCGPPSYAENLNELPSSLIRQMLKAGVISKGEKDLFGYGQSFLLSTLNLVDIVDRFRSEMKKGLSGRFSSLAMLPTFVSNPCGEEKGSFLAIDLGGSNLRILLVNLFGHKKRPKVIIETYPLRATKKEQRVGLDYDYTKTNAQSFFGALAHFTRIFLEKYKRYIAKHKLPLPLGFTFSFPVKKRTIDEALVLRMAKEFRIPDIIDKDAVYLLRESLKAEGLTDLVKLVSINNDTVATLVAGNYQDTNCDIGGIVGTGTNFCYLESLKDIHTLTADEKDGFVGSKMIINIESGNFNQIPQNSYDRLLDKGSLNLGQHILEKMVSGLYLGELVHLVLVDLITKGYLFKYENMHELIALITQRGSFETSFMTEIAKDSTKNLTKVGKRLEAWGIDKKHISLEDKKIIKGVCRLIAKRSARITGACVFSIVTHIDENLSHNHSVAIDGSLFKNYPYFKEDMLEAIDELSRHLFKTDRSHNISLKLTPDASGIGAAIIAATRFILTMRK